MGVPVITHRAWAFSAHATDQGQTHQFLFSAQPDCLLMCTIVPTHTRRTFLPGMATCSLFSSIRLLAHSVLLHPHTLATSSSLEPQRETIVCNVVDDVAIIAFLPPPWKA